MVEAIVEHDYNAKQADELTIKKGDVIRDVVKKQDGWSEGVLDGRRGLFPDNFAVLLHQVSLRANAPAIRKCRVVYSYKQEHEDELNLNVGDVIEIIGEDEEGWWRGRLNGKLGVFPSNFVEEISPAVPPPSTKPKDSKEPDDKEASVLDTKQSKIYCEVKYAYQAQNADELTLKEGDLVTLISKDGQDAGWWRGELHGKVGVFPDNFVAIVDLSTERSPEDKVEKRPGNHVKTHVASQRRSQEVKPLKMDPVPPTQNVNNTSATSPAAVSATPPAVPNKKPSIQFKKSPSSSGGGLFSSLTKKIADTIDGTASSKSVKLTSEPTEAPTESYHAFDQVERNSILPDVRAGRVKAPGRRPPSVALKDTDVAVINGNSDYGSLEDPQPAPAESTPENAEIKPKTLECQKPPWLAEMKMNMKRTSTSPGPHEKSSKLETSTSSIDDAKSTEVSPVVDMSKSMPAMGFQPKRTPTTPTTKTPPNELERPPVSPVVTIKTELPSPTPSPTVAPSPGATSVEKVALRTKPAVNLRPASIESPPTRVSPKMPPTSTSPTVGQKPTIADRASIGDLSVSTRQYNELVERCNALEAELHRQRDEFRAAIDEMRAKLQVETDLRMLLHVELEKLQTQKAVIDAEEDGVRRRR